ncbi:hypothetical protein BCV70DRAFT_7079 [Testicularia cyperi]|uniref:Pre-mRNA-splicing factor CWC26 n=1 Tax=Testicularia cyperi TaxID=1882483 RepID=A0A317XX22_9BASI|nr:hypothetical protein BCV70DRAFT_7079 [Testicularia cyperi]
MPDPKLQSYLAQHYLSGPKADAILARAADAEGGLKKKKKKRAKLDPAASSSSSSGLIFKDDDDAWKTPAEHDDEDALEASVVVDPEPTKQGTGFKKLWDTGSSSKAEAANEGSAAMTQDSQPPPGVEADNIPTASKAGLRSREEMRAARLAREEQRKAQATSTAPSRSEQTRERSSDPDAEADERQQQTVYRDSSGRRIDLEAEQAAERAREAEAERRRKERETWGQGLVQKQAAQQANEELARVRESRVERRADDRDLNRYLKEQQRTDDPAIAFLTKKRSAQPAKPKYKGPFPPNRFNIPPGYRWDGVDRSNGFEKLLFQRKHTLARRDAEARAWGQSDM